MQILQHLGLSGRRSAQRFSALACALFGGFIGYGWAQQHRLAASETVAIYKAALRFSAHLDTGAAVSSINARAIGVLGGAGSPQRHDAGKRVRFTVENAAGKKARVEATIDHVRGIQMSDCRELRYHECLTVVHAGTPYRVLMNLNNRGDSKDKLLLTRNWLRHGFVVDVSRT